jgi:peptidylprolyl isomerase
VGSRVILVIPSALGYGKAGNPPSIPKNADLIFSIDILAAN